MQTIRRAQMAVFQQAVDARLVQELLAWVRTHFPADQTSAGDPKLHAAVREAVAAARGFGLESARDLYRYIALSALLGWGFEHRPEWRWITAILSDPLTSVPGRRLERAIGEYLSRLETEEYNRLSESTFKTVP